MAINGTQHSEGQKALLDLESRFTSKKTSVHGINGMQLKVLALFPRLFEDYPYPVVITAAVLKLTDWFRQRYQSGMNKRSLHIETLQSHPLSPQ